MADNCTKLTKSRVKKVDGCALIEDLLWKAKMRRKETHIYIEIMARGMKGHFGSSD